ncbi:MAG: alanine racemase, partial [Rubripirellula sp.]
MNMEWQEIEGLADVASPGLLVDVDRMSLNLNSMVGMVDGETSRLRPHVKTHKMPIVTRMQVERGITKFKAATIAEAAMVAENGGQDILLAYQPVGPNLERLLQLATDHPNVSFATVVDDIQIANDLARLSGDQGHTLRLFIDVDCGMHRTGIPLGDALAELRTVIESHDSLDFAGLHVYDGHLHQSSLSERRLAASEIIAAIQSYDALNPSPTIIGGGSPTFASWAKETNFECSPGTTIFWDLGYGD